MEKKVLTMPIKEEDVRELKLGDVVYLTGHIFTSRDMGHLRIRQLLEKGEPRRRISTALPSSMPARYA